MKKRILISDDDPEIRLILKTRLEKNGYEISTAEDGASALEKARSEKPDLIMMDVNMPPPNGYQACRQLKDDQELKKIPVVLLTAKTSDSDKFWGLESGADAYLTKPYSSEELLNKIRSLIGP